MSKSKRQAALSTSHSPATTRKPQDHAEHRYEAFEASVAREFGKITEPLFTTNIGEGQLWDTYLSAIPYEYRQHYTCHACRSFVIRHGGLVTIGDHGDLTSAVWENVKSPPFFGQVVSDLKKLVRHATVTGVFLPTGVLGTPRTGIWTHLHGHPAKLYTARHPDAGQAMAEKVQDFQMLSQGIRDYNKNTVEQALRVLKADALDRSEKTLGVAQWFSDLHEQLYNKGSNKARHDNLIWKAVATAPPGFCHVRSSMISTLLDDILAGYSFDVISKRWADKMHPMQYQRPQAAPKEGNIRQAEALVEKLGLTRSFARRFARMTDVQEKLWVPRRMPAKPRKKVSTGVFSHLHQPQPSRQVNLPTQNITWAKFQRDVLPEAYGIEIQCPSSGNYYGLVTASSPSAPPIIQWDGLDGHKRNPVSWYVYNPVSPASNWGLGAGWNQVSAIFMGPHLWQEPEKFKHQNPNVHFAITGARDHQSPGLCLFPEILKSDLHEVRSTIEAHNKTGRVEQNYGEQANGLMYTGKEPVTVRVTTADGTATYRIDRFE
jgi:hypothetical protein